MYQKVSMTIFKAMKVVAVNFIRWSMLLESYFISLRALSHGDNNKNYVLQNLNAAQLCCGRSENKKF